MEKKRFYNFDILKIIAAMLIVFHHYQQLSDIQFKYINFYGGVIPFGYLVELFFIISGFLMAMSYKSDKGIAKSIINRILRLIPMAILTVAITYVIFLIYKIILGNCMFDTDYSLIQLITSLFLVNQGWIKEFAPAINNPIWYICVLLVLNIVYIILVNISKDNKKIVIFVSLFFVLLGIAGMKFKFDYPFLHGSNCRGYATFFMGVLLYELPYKMIGKRNRLIISCVLIMTGCLAIAYLRNFNWYVLVSSVIPGVTLLLSTSPQIELKGISFAGGYSYEVYLWHMPLYCLIKLIFDTNNIMIHHSYLTMFLFLIFVESIAVLLYKYLEKPINKMVRNKLDFYMEKRA